MHFSAGLPGADVPVGLPWHALALARLCLSCDLAPCPRPRFLLPGLPRGGRALRRWKNPVRGAAWGPGVLGERRSVGLGGASAPQGAPPPSGEGAEGKTRLGPTVGTCPRLVSAGAWPWVPLTPTRTRGGPDVPLVEEPGGKGLAGRPPRGEETGSSRSGPSRSGARELQLEPTQRTFQTAWPRCPASAVSRLWGRRAFPQASAWPGPPGSWSGIRLGRQRL